jgi:hypothetical protein
MPELAVDTAAIVIRGRFDPTKLSVKELVDQELLAPHYLSQATQRLSTDDISLLETKSFRFLANRELIQLAAQEADEFSPLRDTAVNLLRLLKDEPISLLGINRDVHFAATNVNAWHAVGDTFAPKEVWDGTLELVGMASLVLQALRPDLYQGYRQITLQPSAVIPQGVYVSHNDHYTLGSNDRIPTNREQLAAVSRQSAEATPEKVAIAINILNNEWDNSMNRALSVIARVAEEAK